MIKMDKARTMMIAKELIRRGYVTGPVTDIDLVKAADIIKGFEDDFFINILGLSNNTAKCFYNSPDQLADMTRIICGLNDITVSFYITKEESAKILVLLTAIAKERQKKLLPKSSQDVSKDLDKANLINELKILSASLFIKAGQLRCNHDIDIANLIEAEALIDNFIIVER